MRILILSFYYLPDIGPGALRAKSIVDALISEGPPDIKIDIITTMPNRYHNMNLSSLKFQNNEKVSINRIKIPKHKNGMFDQSKSYLIFSLIARKLILNRRWDIVVATSSRLMTASLGVWIAKKTNAKLFLDIRDLFTDTMNSILIKKHLRLFLPLFYKLEKWTYSSADKLNVVSAGFVDHIKAISPNISPTVYTNGIDQLFLKNNFSANKIRHKPIILYIGNIGHGQGLHKIIPKASKELKDIQFKIIGDGSASKLLKYCIESKSQDNVKILNPISRNLLIKEYQKADILFLHLNDYEALKKVLPSKIFEYAATGKPILAGVSGYSAEFIYKNIKGAEIFNPCDLKSLKTGLDKLLNGPKTIDRREFCHKFSRVKIMKKLASDVLSLI